MGISLSTSKVVKSEISTLNNKLNNVNNSKYLMAAKGKNNYNPGVLDAMRIALKFTFWAISSRLCSNSKKAIKIKPYVMPVGGPKIDINGGKTNVHDAWTKYIEDLEQNTNKENHDIKQKYFDDVFTKEAQKADEMETLAKDRFIKRTFKNW